MADLAELLPPDRARLREAARGGSDRLERHYDFKLDWMGRAQFDGATANSNSNNPRDPLQSLCSRRSNVLDRRYLRVIYGKDEITAPILRISIVVIFPVVLVGCRTTGAPSPQYTEADAPLRYEVKGVASLGVKQDFASIFGTGDGKHLWVCAMLREANWSRSSGTCLGSNNRAIPWLQAADSVGGQ